MERGLNYNYAEQFTEAFKKLELMFSGMGKWEARKKINDLLMDRSEHGRVLVSKFTRSYYEAKKNFNSLTRAVATSSGPEKGANFKAKILALDTTHDVIKPHMIRALKTAFPTKIDFFTESEADMEAYEKDLQKRLGKDYERQIADLVERLTKFEIFEENQATISPLNAGKRIAEESPWEFTRDLEFFIETAKLGGTEELMSPYDRPDGVVGYTYNNAMGRLTLIPKGDSTSNKDHYSEQFNEVEATDEAYAAWEATNEYYTKFINPRLNKPPTYLSKIKGEFFQQLSQTYRDKDLFEAVKFALKGILDHLRSIAIEQGVHYDHLNTVKSEYVDATEQDIKKEATILRTKSFEQLEDLIESNKIDFTDTQDKAFERLKDLPENITRSEEDIMKMALKEVKEGMVQALAKEYTFSRYSSDFLRTTLALGQLAYVQKAQEETLKVSTLLKMAATLRTGGERKHADKKFDKWIETSVKNNLKAFNKTVESNTAEKDSTGRQVKPEDNLAPLKEVNRKGSNLMNAELMDSEYSMDTKIGRIANTLKRYGLKTYDEVDKKLLDFTNNMLKTENFSEDFEFKTPYISPSGEEVTATYKPNEEGFERTYSYIDEGGRVAHKNDSIEKSEYTQNLGKYYSFLLNNLGNGKSASGFAKTFFSGLSYGMLAFKPLSGMVNRGEGKQSLKVDDARQGIRELKDANGNTILVNRIATGLTADSFMAGYNSFKFNVSKSIGKNKKAQYKTLDQLCDLMDVFQSRSNLIDRLDPNHTLANKFRETFNPYNAAIDFPERKNQYGVLLRNLAETFVLDINGNSHPVVGDLVQFEKGGKQRPLYGPDGSVKTRGTGFNIYLPGTLTLKDEFRTKENIAQWEKFEVDFSTKNSANNLITQGARTTLNINATAGNFSKDDMQPALDTGLGIYTSVFNRWFGARVRRFFLDDNHLNPITGQKSRKAYIHRKNILSSPALVLGTGSMLTVMSAGALSSILPGLAIAGGAAFAVMTFSRLSKNSSSELKSRDAILGFATEILVRTLETPSSFFFNSRTLNITGRAGYDKMSPLQRGVNNKTVTKEEAEGLRVLAQQMALNVWALALPVLAQALYPMVAEMVDIMTGFDDDDDEEEKERKMNLEKKIMALAKGYLFLINNLGNRVLDMNTPEYQPVKFLKEKAQFVAMSNLEKTAREISKFEEEQDAGTTTSALSSILSTLNINPIPNGVQNMAKYVLTGSDKGSLLFADSRVYDNSRFNQDLIRKYKPSEDRLEYFLNSSGDHFKADIYKALIETNIEEQELGPNDLVQKEKFEHALKNAPEYKFIKKKPGEKYIDNLRRIKEGLESNEIFLKKYPELVQKAEKNYKIFKAASDKEEAHLKTLPESVQSKDNYRPSDGKVKSTMKDRKKVVEHIIDAADKLPEADMSQFDMSTNDEEED